METLKQKHEAYNDRLKAKGVQMLTCILPCCGGTLESRVGEPGRQWDTLATCPECGELFMKITTGTNLVALIPEGV